MSDFVSDQQKCIHCGCTDDHACQNADGMCCSWVKVDRCSFCIADYLELRLIGTSTKLDDIVRILYTMDPCTIREIHAALSAVGIRRRSSRTTKNNLQELHTRDLVKHSARKTTVRGPKPEEWSLTELGVEYAETITGDF